MTRVKVYDISVPLRADMPTYSGEPGPRLQFAKQLSKGDSANVSVLSLGSHTGTHVDAPSHFLDGAPGVDSLPPEALVGPAFVAEHGGESHITAADLDALAIPPDCQRLLFKTRSGRFWDDTEFHRDFIARAPDAAPAPAERGLPLAGID